MNNKTKKLNNKTKKLKKLNFKRGKVLLKNPELVSIIGNSAAVSAAVATVSAAAISAVGTGRGANLGESMLLGGMMTLGCSPLAGLVKEHSMFSTMMKDKNAKDLLLTQKQARALFAAGLATTVLSTGIGVGVGAGTHKLTTAIIDKVKPQHQIEQTVEVEPMPVIDEIQVEK